MEQTHNTYMQEVQKKDKPASAAQGFRRYQIILWITTVLTFLLIISMVIIGANMPESTMGKRHICTYGGDPYINITDYNEYIAFLEAGLEPTEFVRYAALTKLGAFQKFTYLHDRSAFRWYRYSLVDANRQVITVTIDHEYSPQKYNELTALPENLSSMASLGSGWEGFAYYRRGQLQYFYSQGSLVSISWNSGETIYQISCDFAKYPTKNPEATTVSKLLSLSETEAFAALEALQKDMQGQQTKKQLQALWDTMKELAPAILLLLVGGALLWVDISASKTFFKKQGTKRPVSKKRYLLWLVIALMLLLAVCGIIDTCVLSNIGISFLEPVRIICPGPLQVLQLREGMTHWEVREIMGQYNQAWYGNNNNPAWSTLFGGTVIVKFADEQVTSWEYRPFASSNGWILPGILVLFGFFGFVFYRIRFHRKKISKKRCVVWIALSLVVLFGALCAVDAFLLPWYDYYNFNDGERFRLFHPAVFQLSQIEENAKLKHVEAILGDPSRAYKLEAKKYIQNAATEWDLPFGAVYRHTTENGSGIFFFASTAGLVVPLVLLLAFWTGLLCYGYLFYGDQLGALFRKRQPAYRL